jgi:hypothetical protein
MQSPAATELPGVAELAGRVLSTPELITAWTPALAFRLGLQWEPGVLSGEETAAAARIEGEKFAASAWTERR